MLPRFKVEYEVKLNDTLKALGMGIAFGSRANFEDMCAGPLGISVVRHKAHMEVNEEGTEAAAATAVIMSRSVSTRFMMAVDRPLFCAIRDNETGEVLFMGSIVEPG
jgi:serpin B